MTTAPFNDGWTFRRADEDDETWVTLPHDAMIGEARVAEGGSEHHGGFFPGGRYVYSKTWVPRVSPESSNRLVFEAVYGDTTVILNGVEIGHNDSGYREFAVDLDPALQPGRENVLEVHVDNQATPNSRWYTGSGIYRRVWFEERATTRIADGGVQLHTRTLTADMAEIAATVVVDGAADGTDVRVTFSRDDVVVAGATATLHNGVATLVVVLASPHAWSHRDPFLYDVVVDVRDEHDTLDSRDLRFGLRQITVDARQGLRVNGTPVLLQGAAVHHDNGVLGAATLRAAEFRRARILKANGFNAIRSAHQPMSRDLLDAADEVGLYVIDELTDIWNQRKTAHDASKHFQESWRTDARSMVAKARNHPSVIMYSVGNEIGETASPAGVQTTRELSAFFRQLDPHRPTTLAVNFLVNVMSSRGTDLFTASEPKKRKPLASKNTPVTSTVANVMMNRIGSIMQFVSKLPVANKTTRDAFAEVDVAGYNYAWGRYENDARRHPHRVMYGSETLMGDVVKAWRLVETTPNLIGDFVWSGWDYLGETGLGTWTYGAGDVMLSKAYPHILAGCGVIDILGNPGAAALQQRALWGELPVPGIAVRPLDHSGESTHRVAWRSTDAIESWAWNGREGTRAEIEVYSADDEVELLLNGRSLGRKPTGRKRQFVARFRTAWTPGTLEAIGYRNGIETGRSSLRSAGATALRLVVEREAVAGDGQDLAYVHLQIADDDGTVEMLADDTVTITVEGPGVLAGFGSASPTTEGRFTDATTQTHYGRALAVVRSTGETGTITITAISEAHGTATQIVHASAAAGPLTA